MNSFYLMGVKQAISVIKKKSVHGQPQGYPKTV